MGKSETSLLPPESAKAIYLAIEEASRSNTQRVEDQNRRLDAQNHVLDRIVDGIEQLKDKLNTGAVRFEHHSGEIRRLDGEMKRVSGTLNDVESDVQRIKPRVLGTTPTAPFPSRRPGDAVLRTPSGVPAHRRGDDDDAPIITIRWPKVINTLIIAFVSVFGTLAASWLFGHGSKAIAPIESSVGPRKTPPVTADPPSALDIQDAGGPAP